MAHRMPWSAAALVLAAMLACASPPNEPTAPAGEQPAPSPSSPAKLEVLIVDADGKVTKATMPAPTLVLSSSDTKVEALFRSLDENKLLLEGHEQVHLYALDPAGLAQRPCHEGAGCVSPPPPPKLTGAAYLVVAPQALEQLEGPYGPGGQPIGPNGQAPEVELPLHAK